MTYTVVQASTQDKDELATIRGEAMRESLEAIGRFDPRRARLRFLDRFDEQATHKILISNDVVGFYVTHEREDHIWLDHSIQILWSQSDHGSS